MLERERLESKKISQDPGRHLADPARDRRKRNVHIGPSDYVPWLDDRKWAYVRLEGRAFGDVPLNLEYKLEVWDSPNSAGVIIDAVRAAKIAKDRGIGGPILSASSYFMKSPPEQYSDDDGARRRREVHPRRGRALGALPYRRGPVPHPGNRPSPAAGHRGGAVPTAARWRAEATAASSSRSRHRRPARPGRTRRRTRPARAGPAAPADRQPPGSRPRVPSRPARPTPAAGRPAPLSPARSRGPRRARIGGTRSSGPARPAGDRLRQLVRTARTGDPAGCHPDGRSLAGHRDTGRRAGRGGTSTAHSAVTATAPAASAAAASRMSTPPRPAAQSSGHGGAEQAEAPGQRARDQHPAGRYHRRGGLPPVPVVLGHVRLVRARPADQPAQHRDRGQREAGGDPGGADRRVPLRHPQVGVRATGGDDHHADRERRRRAASPYAASSQATQRSVCGR